MPQTPAGILTGMRSVSPSSPRLVWHGGDGRIELSGRVFDNWVAKSSNLLVDELDATDGSLVSFDLPVHWKSLALAFACWQVGALVVLPDTDTDTDTDTDIVLSSRAAGAVEPPRLLACVALGSLALRWDGPLPQGAVDFAAEVRSHGDVYLGQPRDDVGAALVLAGGRTLTAQDLLASIALPTGTGPVASASDATATAVGGQDGLTLLLEPGASLGRALAAALAVWDSGGVLVLVENGVPVTDRMLAGERVTGRLGAT
ncbi:TIGR03089 family protein [Arthrobacter ruber]|uniref:TIGR03089 family protein n=1 Tax=Arthrobacter ruber TaxID=1258893 RepID=UPI000CF4D855|nr:TIGR03089 family protein [Arthrobacter ruber]